jgi:hypothetical protein
MVPREPIFEKCSHLREKGGADAFENKPSVRSKDTVGKSLLWRYLLKFSR